MSDGPLPIQFVRTWRGRQIGEIEKCFSYGLAQSLIDNNWAKKYVKPVRKPKSKSEQQEIANQSSDA